MRHEHERSANRWRSCILGAIGGLAGVAAMNIFLKKTANRSGPAPVVSDERSVSLIGPHHREGESATAAVGRLAYHYATGHDPESEEMKSALGEMAHWIHGMDMGALYGLSQDIGPLKGLSGGLAFGAGLWLAADEMAAPLLGLAEGPTAYPPGAHARALGAHLVYGLTLAAAYKALDRMV
ncbi:MAG TPA: hypothetical protein VFY29_15240 [Terriglobia bacterium]|nr:hypothetical protein [Terriglobia bacterium]